ncbi:MAG: methyltransferase domain-containing protein [Candidatus Dormiibacterota bacterium]
MTPQLPADTGERVLVQDPLHPRQNPHELAHVPRYAFARHLLGEPAGVVVDVACGIGYGAVQLNPDRRAAGVLGIDIDGPSLVYARHRFGAHGAFVRGSATGLPLRDASIPAVVSLETIEHLADPAGCIGEYARVLSDGGTLVVSTPDPEMSRLFNFGDANPFHLRELTRREFRQALDRHFGEVEHYGQTPIDPSVWRARNDSLRNRVRRLAKSLDRAGVARAAYLAARRVRWLDARLDQYGAIDHSIVADRGESFLVMIAVCRRPRRDR